MIVISMVCGGGEVSPRTPGWAAAGPKDLSPSQGHLHISPSLSATWPGTTRPPNQDESGLPSENHWQSFTSKSRFPRRGLGNPVASAHLCILSVIAWCCWEPPLHFWGIWGSGGSSLRWGSFLSRADTPGGSLVTEVCLC